MDAGPAALDELYGSHFRAVYGLCRSMLANPEEAADAAHDVFARAVQGEGSWQSREHARAWLIEVARHHCIDLIRRRERLGRALTRVGTSAEQTPDPERVALDRQVLRSVFRALSPRDRFLLWQSAVERRSVVDIAARLRLSYQTAAQAVYRARRRAELIAARVAILIGLIRLTRPARRGSALVVTAPQALLVALVPLIVASTAASTASRAAQPVPAVIQPSVPGTSAKSSPIAAQAHVPQGGTPVPASAVVQGPSVSAPAAIPMTTTIEAVHQRLAQTRLDADTVETLVTTALPASVQAASPNLPAPIPAPSVMPTP